MILRSALSKLLIHQRKLYVFIFAFCLYNKTSAQNEIPIETWRSHLSYSTINTIALGIDKVYSASENGILMLDRSDNSLTTYSKLNGLSDGGLSCINYNQQTGQLVVAYKDGNLDIIKGADVINFNRLKNATAVTGSKKINYIAFKSNTAFLSTDYGLVVFDLSSNEVKETWRDLGIGGSKLKIFQSAFWGDSIFLATEKGIIAGNLNDNLLDYNKWKRFNLGAFSGAVQSIASTNERVYAAINNSGIYYYEKGKWIKENFLQNNIFRSINSNGKNLIITDSTSVWKLDQQNILLQVVDGNIQSPKFSIEDNSGKLWIGDQNNGLVSDIGGNFASYIPNGPRSLSTRLKYYNKTIYSLPGGYSKSFGALNNIGGYDSFTDGLWTYHSSDLSDLTDIDFANGKTYVSSFGYGLEVLDDKNNIQIFNASNSPLINANPPAKNVNISAIENSYDGLWVANYGAVNSLNLLNNNSQWESFSFSNPASRFPTELLVDLNGYVWSVLSSKGGLFIFDKTKNRSTNIINDKGVKALPGEDVTSIAIDRDGYVWVGTDGGIAYFIDTYNVFTQGTDIVEPIFENRRLLKTEVITAIAVDGANRKWIGTEKGVWLFNSTGESQIYNFTTENSPLISNIIRDIEINPTTGEVFFATDAGLVSFRSNATEGTQSFQTIKIFPNPVLSTFNGTIGINGLAEDSFVKITDISGKLLWQTQANGGTATWNMKDYNGHRASTGIYLVFAATKDASESVVGKIAIIE